MNSIYFLQHLDNFDKDHKWMNTAITYWSEAPLNLNILLLQSQIFFLDTIKISHDKINFPGKNFHTDFFSVFIPVSETEFVPVGNIIISTPSLCMNVSFKIIFIPDSSFVAHVHHIVFISIIIADKDPFHERRLVGSNG